MGFTALPLVTIFFVLAADAAPGEVPSESRATVNADLVPVHPETSKASEVLRTLNKGDMVTIDGNHPLADEHLNFAIEITDVREPTAEEMAHGHVHGPGGHHHHD